MQFMKTGNNGCENGSGGGGGMMWPVQTRYELRVPTKEQYAYITCFYEGDAAGAVSAYNELTRAVLGGTGVGMKALAGIVIELVKTGGISMGGNYDFSSNESALIGEITKQLRKNNRDKPLMQKHDWIDDIEITK